MPHSRDLQQCSAALLREACPCRHQGFCSFFLFLLFLPEKQQVRLAESRSIRPPMCCHQVLLGGHIDQISASSRTSGCHYHLPRGLMGLQHTCTFIKCKNLCPPLAAAAAQCSSWQLHDTGSTACCFEPVHLCFGTWVSLAVFHLAHVQAAACWLAS